MTENEVAARIVILKLFGIRGARIGMSISDWRLPNGETICGQIHRPSPYCLMCNRIWYDSDVGADRYYDR